MMNFDIGMVMLKLDVGTLAFSTALIAAAAAAIMTVGRGHPAVASWREFAASSACYGIGILIVTFPHSLGPGYAVVVGNALVVVSTLLVHAGACALAKRRPPVVTYLAVTILAVALYHVAYRMDYSIAAVSAIRIPFYVHALWLLRGAGSSGHRTGVSIMAATLAGWTALVLYRILDVAWSGPREFDFGAGTIVQALYFGGASPLFVAMCLAMLQIRFDRDEELLSDRIAVQSQALQTARRTAEAALVSKSRFLAATSHDLRQAVHALRLLTYVAAEEAAVSDKGGGTLSDMVADMTRVVNGMTDQLNALLDMARLDAGTVNPVSAVFTVQDVFDRLAGRFDGLAASAGVTLRFVPSARLVHTDPALLDRILSGLVANAIKFTPGGRVLVGCRLRPEHVDILVCDTGIGIPESRFADIFEEYKQFDDGARPQGRGLGLGLAIARRTADLLGLPLSVRSQVGKGSVFTVRLPRADPPCAPPP